ncbi:MAG: hypothetical protein J6X69_04735 [Bacteroidales bacterium]|nr:hypothetical protein [Bacteroidales bacterium]
MKYILMMAMGLLGCCLMQARPKGDLVYCSYARHGAAGLGSDYCELIADVADSAKVVVVLDEGNRFGNPVIRREFPVEKSVVDSLSQILQEGKFYKLNGYRLEEPICGGHSYRIHMEYSSGDQVTAYWYGHKVKDKAIEAYNTIEHFFAPWRAETAR